MSKRELADALAKLKATYEETVAAANRKCDGEVAAAEGSRKRSMVSVNETFQDSKAKVDFRVDNLVKSAKSELAACLKQAQETYDKAVIEAKRFSADQLSLSPWKADLP